MELRQYLAIARKWLWLLILGTLVAGTVALFISLAMPKIYRASVKLLVNQAQNPNSVTYNDVLTSQQLTKTYANMIRDWPVLDEVNRSLNTGYTTEQLADQISVEAIRDTMLLRVSIENTNPTLAKDIANKLAEVFIERDNTMQLNQSSDSRQIINEQLAAIEQDMRNTSSQIESLRSGSGNYTTEERNTELARLQGLLAQYQTSYTNLIKADQEMRLAEAGSADTIRVTEPAVQPIKPVKPQVMLNTLVAVALGLMLSATIACLIEHLDDSIKTSEMVQAQTGLSTLGFIAYIPHKLDKEVIVVNEYSRSPLAEAYRTLRTNIQFAAVDKQVKQLLITSSNPGEGKSTTVANLAACLAQAGQRVLAVDCDLRRPSLHRMFGLSNAEGLTNLLLDENASPEQIIQETGTPNLRLLTSGPLPPNPSELLSSYRMKVVLEKLSEAVDVLMLDSSPLLPVTDPSVLATRVGNALLVVDWGHTRIGELKRAVQSLAGVGVKPLGVVGNKISVKSGGYYHYYNRYYTELRPQITGNGRKPEEPQRIGGLSAER